MGELDLTTVPTDGATHDLSLYMEDTGWPHAPIDDYVEFWGTGYYEPMKEGRRTSSTSRRYSRWRSERDCARKRSSCRRS